MAEEGGLNPGLMKNSVDTMSSRRRAKNQSFVREWVTYWSSNVLQYYPWRVQTRLSRCARVDQILIFIYLKQKNRICENDKILLPEKELNNKRRYSDNDSPYLPPKFSSKNSTFQSPQKTNPTNVNDINSQDYDPILSNVIAVPESPATVFIKFNPS